MRSLGDMSSMSSDNTNPGPYSFSRIVNRLMKASICSSSIPESYPPADEGLLGLKVYSKPRN